MALRIYIRQHSPDCLKNIQARVDRKEIQPLSKKDLMDYRHCRCAWWMYGASDYGQKHKPHALNVYSYGAAEAVRKAANKPPVESEDASLTVKELWAQFMAGRQRAEGTNDNYEVVGARLLNFCERQNPRIEHAAKFTPTHGQALRDEWGAKVKRTTANNHVTILKTLFNYAVKMHLLKINPMTPVAFLDPPRASDADHIDPAALDVDSDEESNRTLPLDPDGGDANYRALLDGIGPCFGGKIARPGKKPQRRSTPFLLDFNRYSLLLQFLYETGLRISDAMHARPERFILNEAGPKEEHVAEYTTRQIKTGGSVTTYFPIELAKQIQALEPYRNGYVFFDGSQPWKLFRRAVIGRSLAELGEAVGVTEARCHRFRDSFAVNQLNDYMTFERLAELLGHKDVKTTKDHYNPWVKSRQDNSREAYLEARAHGQAQAKKRNVVPINRAG
jgi:integrase